MSRTPRIVVTGTGAICAAGRTPGEILDAVHAGRSAIAPIRQWDASGWPTRAGGEIPDFNASALIPDRKLHKLIRRTDLLGLYAASRAIEDSGLVTHRETLDEELSAAYNDRTGVYAGAGGGAYQNQYDFFPLLTAAQGDLAAFGRELDGTVNPMWLLRSLPNNVLCHIGIRYGLKGANACVTNHALSGILAVVEAVEALRGDEVDRAVAVGHDAPIEPQMVLYYAQMGLFAVDSLRPFDVGRTGSLFGEGAGALVVETEAAAAERRAPILGEILGSGVALESAGLFAIRDDGEGIARAIKLALDDAGVSTADVGMIAAHGNGTPKSDASEALAIRRVFGAAPPPITAFKWAFGHLIAASGAIEAVLTLAALRHGVVPGIANLQQLDPKFGELPISARPQQPRTEVGLVLSRGFGGTNAALLVRAARGKTD